MSAFRQKVSRVVYFLVSKVKEALAFSTGKVEVSFEGSRLSLER